MDTVTDEVKLRNAGRIPYTTLQVSSIRDPSMVMLIFPLLGCCWSFLWRICFNRCGPHGHQDTYSSCAHSRWLFPTTLPRMPYWCRYSRLEIHQDYIHRWSSRVGPATEYSVFERGPFSRSWCNFGHWCFMVSYVDRHILCQILLFGPVQTFDKTALEDHLYLLLDCRGAHGAHVAVHG